jgi:Transposase DDE domain
MGAFVFRMFADTLYIIKDKIIQFVNSGKLKFQTKSNPQGRPLKIENVDALALALYQHASGRVTKKSVWSDFKHGLGCSYKTFVCAVNRAGMMAAKLLFLLVREGKKVAHTIKMTDATDLPVCLKKNMDSHRTMRGLAELARSAKGWFYGLKMTMTRDLEGRLLGLKFSSAHANDRELFASINEDVGGVILADAGYISKKLEKKMNIEGKRWVVIQPKKTMKKLALPWQLKLYKLRFAIEFDFRSMKLFHGLVTSMPRSVNGYLANYLNAVCSFVIAK